MPIAITPTEIEDVLLVATSTSRDSRGSFAETYSRDMFAEKGFHETFVQDCLSRSKRGTLRGLHYQVNPMGVGKLIRVVSGRAFDVVVDLRRGSPTFGKWIGEELSAPNGLALWAPIGFAHGFVALTDNTLVHYKFTTPHSPKHERALNFADPEVGIDWPLEPTTVSARDAAAPMLRDADYNFVYEVP